MNVGRKQTQAQVFHTRGISIAWLARQFFFGVAVFSHFVEHSTWRFGIADDLLTIRIFSVA